MKIEIEISRAEDLSCARVLMGDKAGMGYPAADGVRRDAVIERILRAVDAKRKTKKRGAR